MSFKNKLAALKDNYSKAKEAKDTPFEINIENGKYRVALTDLELRESQSSGKLMVKREWTVLEGDHADTVFSDYIHLESSEWGMVHLQRFIEQMGYEVPENPEGIEDVLSAILGEKPECIITVRIKDDFVNVRVREVLTSQSAAEAGTEAPEVEAEAEAEAEADDLAGLDRAALKAILKAEEIDFVVYKTTTDDAIREAITTARTAKAEADAASDGAEPEAEEPEAEPEAEPEPEAPKAAKGKATPASAPKPSDKLTALKNFCDANDVTYDRKKADEKSLIAAIKKGKYKAKDLTAKEQKLLKDIGVSVK